MKHYLTANIIQKLNFDTRKRKILLKNLFFAVKLPNLPKLPKLPKLITLATLATLATPATGCSKCSRM